MKNAGRAAGIVLVCALAAIAALALWYGNAAYRDRQLPASTADVVVPRGSTLTGVAAQLARSGVISNALVFRILAKARHAEYAVHAGGYRFPPHLTQREVLDALLSGGAQTAAWVAIPEGFTAAQIAERVEQAGVTSSAAADHEFLNTSMTLDGVRTKNLEGFLFPSTYLVPTNATAAQVAKQLTDEFKKQLPADAAARAKRNGLDVVQAVTVASLVEREARIDADRPMIAGVIYNRLHDGIPLQVDATIEYALPQHKAELSFGDLKIDSPYNTYLHAGLPPTPIANPGLASILAALDPSKTDMLYYVYCGNGHHVFSKTLAEHQANVARCLK